MTPCIEWQGARSKAGYGQRWNPATQKVEYVHRQIYEQHHGPIPAGMKVLHECDNPPCYNIDHLFLGTTKDNAVDMAEKGRQVFQKNPEKHPRGEPHHNAKVTEQDVRDMRASSLTQRQLADKYGLSQATVWAIVKRRTWSHVS